MINVNSVLFSTANVRWQIWNKSKSAKMLKWKIDQWSYQWRRYLKTFLLFSECYDTQHNDTQHNDILHNDTQLKGLICDTQHKWHSVKITQSITILCHYAVCHYAECCIFVFIMLNVIMLNIIMLNVVMLSVVTPFLTWPESNPWSSTCAVMLVARGATCW
jgi:hypothetical protein